MAEQEFVFPSSSQLGLKNLPVSVPGNRKEHLWKMDHKTLMHKE
jgi:hypothetical protein